MAKQEVVIVGARQRAQMRQRREQAAQAAALQAAREALAERVYSWWSDSYVTPDELRRQQRAYQQREVFFYTPEWV